MKAYWRLTILFIIVTSIAFNLIRIQTLELEGLLSYVHWIFLLASALVYAGIYLSEESKQVKS